jgi:hypothetical protein
MPDPIKSLFEATRSKRLFLDEADLKNQIAKDPNGVFNIVSDSKLFLDFDDFQNALGLKKKETSPFIGPSSTQSFVDLPWNTSIKQPVVSQSQSLLPSGKSKSIERIESFSADTNDFFKAFQEDPKKFTDWASTAFPTISYDEIKKSKGGADKSFVDDAFIFRISKAYEDRKNDIILQNSRTQRKNIEGTLQGNLTELSKVAGKDIQIPTTIEQAQQLMQELKPRPVTDPATKPAVDQYNKTLDGLKGNITGNLNAVIGSIVLRDMSARNPNVTPIEIGREVMKLTNPELFKQYEAAGGGKSYGGWGGIGVRETPVYADDINRQMTQIGNEIMKMYGNKTAIERANLEEKVLQNKFTYGEQERVKNKIASALYQKGVKPTSASQDQINQVVESLPEEDKSFWKQAQEDNNAKLPSTGFGYSLKNGYSGVVTDAVKTLLTPLIPNKTREQALENLKSMSSSDVVGENPQEVSRFEALNKKKADGVITAQETAELEDLKGRVRVRTGLEKILDFAGGGLGQIAGLGTISAFTGGLSQARTVGGALKSLAFPSGGSKGISAAAYLMANEGNQKEAIRLFPDSDVKQALASTAFNAIDMLVERLFPEEQVLTKTIKNDVVGELSKISRDKISEQLVDNVAKQAARTIVRSGKEVLKAPLQETAEEEIAMVLKDAIVQPILNPEFSKEGVTLKKIIETGEQAFWGAALLGAPKGLMALRDTRVPIETIWNTVSSPTEFIKINDTINKMEKAGEITVEDAQEKRTIIAQGIKEYNSNPVVTGQVGKLSLKERQNYFARLMHEKTLENQMNSTTDDNVKADLQSKINDSKVQREKIFKNQVTVNEDNREMPAGMTEEAFNIKERLKTTQGLTDADFVAEPFTPEEDAADREALPQSQFGTETDLENTLKTGQFAMLTGMNPSAQPISKAGNKKLNERAKQWLIDKGFKPIEIFGKYDNSERSFFVPDMTREQAIEFAKEFGQEAVAHSSGMVYQDGSFNPRTGVVEVAPSFGQEGANYFSSINIGGKPVDFKVDYDTNKRYSADGKLIQGQPTDVEQRLSDAMGDAEFMDKVAAAQKSLEKTGVSINVIDNADEYDRITGEVGGQKGTEGIFVSDEGKIYINKAKLEKGITDGLVVWHEAAHPVVNIVRNTNRSLFDSVVNGVKELAKTNKDVADALAWAEKEYQGQETVNDEAVVEVIARVADGIIDLNQVPTGFKQSLIDLINKMAKALGLGQIVNDTDVAAIKKLAGDVANALTTGRDISEVVGEENVKATSAQMNQLRKRSQDIAKDTEDKTIEGESQPSMVLMGKRKGEDVELYSGPASIEAIRNVKPDMYVSRAEDLSKSNLMQGKVRAYPSNASLESKLKWADNVYNKVKETVVSNLLYIFDQIPSEIRDISKLWYDGANIIAQEMSSKYGVTIEQASAVIASQSPQKPWYDNVHLAQFIMDFYSNNMDTKFTQEMYDYYELKSQPTKANPSGYPKQTQYLPTLQKAIGKKFSELSNYDKSVMIRSEFDNKYDRRAPLRIPTGAIVGKVQSMSSFSGYDTIAKGISILSDGSPTNISKNLGNAFKVRNFNNNISNPRLDGEVTIDTHAMAAAYMLPLGSSSPEVKFDEATYAFFADAYRDAAKQRGVLAREMQSIVWEGVRSVFPASDKSSANKEKAKNIWAKYKAGELELADVQKQIKENGKDLSITDWSRFADKLLEENGKPSYLEELPLAGRDKLAVEPGDSGRDIGELPRMGEGGVQASVGGRDLDQRLKNFVDGERAKGTSDADIERAIRNRFPLIDQQRMNTIMGMPTVAEPTPEEKLATVVQPEGEERTRGMEKRFGDLDEDTARKIEDEAKTYFAQTNKQTEKAAEEFMKDKPVEYMADYVVSNPNIPGAVNVWMAATTAKNLGKEIEAAKKAGDVNRVEMLSTMRANIYNHFASKATEIGQTIQAFISFKDDPAANQFMFNKILKQLQDKGVTAITDAQKTEIKRLLDEVSNAPAGLPKDIAITKLSHYLGKMTPINAFDIMQAMWYAKILSGITTQSKNFFANMINTFVEVPIVGLRMSFQTGSLQPMLYAMKGLGGGSIKGLVKAADILKGGITTKQEDKFFNNDNLLEYFKWSDTKIGKTFGGMTGKILDFPLFFETSPTALKYVGRALTASDALFSTANQEAMANMLAFAQAKSEGKSMTGAYARAQEILGNTKKAVGDAKKQAADEGFKPKTTEFKRRVIEIVNQQRGQDIVEKAQDFGKRATLTNEPEGFTRGIYQVATNIQEKLPIARVVIPFTKIVSNISEMLINYSPLGMYRAATGIKNPKFTFKFTPSGDNKLTPEQRADLFIKSTLAITTLTILAGKTGDKEEDWFDVTAGGPTDFAKKYELMKGGWRPYTITMKDGTKINYADWPIAGVISAIGTIHDADRYGNVDTNEWQDKMAVAAYAYMLNFYDKSLVKGISDFVDIFRPEGKYGTDTNMTEKAIKFGTQQAKAVTMSNLSQQALKLVDEYQDEPIKEAKGAEVFYRDIPLLNDGLNPIIDVFGDEVKYATTERLLPWMSVGDEKKDEVLAYLNRNNVFVGMAAERPMINFDTLEERKMTRDELYQYRKLAGQYTKEMLYDNIDLLKEINAMEDGTKLMKKTVADFASASRDKAYAEVLLK